MLTEKLYQLKSQSVLEDTAEFEVLNLSQLIQHTVVSCLPVSLCPLPAYRIALLVLKLLWRNCDLRTDVDFLKTKLLTVDCL